MTEIHVYDAVIIVSDRFDLEGVRSGAHGYVIEDYGDGNFEVEVSNPDTGETIAQIVVSAGELRRIKQT